MRSLAWTHDQARRDDGQLIVEMSGGSREALGELYDRYGNRAYRVAFSVCRDEARAEDAVQEAFLSIWRSGTSYSPVRGTLAPWLLTVVRHRAIDLVRSERIHAARQVSDDHLLDRPTPEDVCEELIEREDAGRYHASLALLPALQQEVIALAFYGQLSYTEIANRLGLPPGTVKGRMLEQTKKFRDVARSGRAAVVIDDLASTNPWHPRAIEVRGPAEAIEDPGAMIRIHAERIISWGLDS